MDTSNIFKGKFQIIAFLQNTDDNGWTCVEHYRNNCLVWKFTETNKLTFPLGTIIYEGKLEEHIRDVTELTEYTYCPMDRQLFIDRSDYCEDGFLWACINDRYRVEQINDDEYSLYDLEDVHNEPDDYRLKLKVKRILLNEP